MATILEYESLDQKSRQIRLLTIHSAESDDTKLIACTLTKVDLLDANPFYALSYVWGPATSVAPVHINGKAVLVRRNLWLFLNTLRQRCASYSTRVWADYICINQDDNRERNYQVSMMGDIYKAADAVYAWLGESISTFGDGMQCIKDAMAMKARHISWVTIAAKLGRIDFRLQDIASSQYWNRMWIKQEAILAKDLWFFFGADRTHWRDLLFVVKMLRPPNERARARDPASTSIKSMLAMLRPRESQRDDEKLSDLVLRYADAQCQDARDRIYALRALVDDTTCRQIDIDYTKPVLQVLLENYTHWTDEDLYSANGSKRARPAEPVYHVSHFCANMHRMLPDADLHALCVSEDARRNVNAHGVFSATDMSTIVRTCAVASIGEGVVLPMKEASEADPCRSAFVLQLSVRPYGTKRALPSRDCYVYTDTMPNAGTLVAWMGARVLFVEGHKQGSPIYTLVGTGTEMTAMATDTEHDQLSRLLLPHPGIWKRQQLPDARFQLLPGSGSIQTQEVKVRCNAAAMVTLLLECKRYRGNWRHDTLEDDHDLDLATSNAKSWPTRWSPYAFGTEHELLDTCALCRSDDRTLSTAQSSPAIKHGMQECTCRWIDS